MSHCNDSTSFSGKVSYVKLSIMSRGTSYIVIQTHFTSGHSLPPNKRRVFELNRKHKKTTLKQILSKHNASIQDP